LHVADQAALIIRKRDSGRERARVRNDEAGGGTAGDGLKPGPVQAAVADDDDFEIAGVGTQLREHAFDEAGLQPGDQQQGYQHRGEADHLVERQAAVKPQALGRERCDLGKPLSGTGHHAAAAI